MKIVVAPDSFKGCLPAREVAAAVCEGLRLALPECETVRLPLSDGGECFAELVTGHLGGKLASTRVHGPLGEEIIAKYGIAGPTGIIEVAQACGLGLVPERRRNPLNTSTLGVGELMLSALEAGCSELIIGLGGTATCDGGAGMMSAPDIRKAMDGVRVRAFCDVRNPYVGPEGAARVFGPQKGASPEVVELIEERMRALAGRMYAETGLDVSALPGSGAAGGIGGALMAYFGAELISGIDAVLDLIGFSGHISDADLIITGEGRSDMQTLSGKVPMGVLEAAGRHGIPVILLSGAVQNEASLLSAGFSKVIAATPEDMPLNEALRPEVAVRNLSRAAATLRMLP